MFFLVPVFDPPRMEAMKKLHHDSSLAILKEWEEEGYGQLEKDKKSTWRKKKGHPNSYEGHEDKKFSRIKTLCTVLIKHRAEKTEAEFEEVVKKYDEILQGSGGLSKLVDYMRDVEGSRPKKTRKRKSTD